MKRIGMMCPPIFGLVAAFAVTSLAPAVSRAIIDTKNSNYGKTTVDASLGGTGYVLKVQRHYNSRSVFNGIFGFGSCSDLETSIVRTPEGRLKLTECGAGQEIIYSAEKFDPKTQEKLIDTLVAHYMKTSPGATPKGAETLRGQLRERAELRSIWASDAGVKLPELKKGSVYFAENLEVEKIAFDGANYTRTLADGTSQRFDNTGKLTHLYDKNGNFLKLVYGPSTLKEVVDNTGRKLNFIFNNKRVEKITGAAGLKVEYKYKGEDLVEVKNMWGNKYTYEYDDNHNLTKINYPDKTFEALTYNKDKDWVTSYTDRAVNGVACNETYKYELDKENPTDHYWSTAVKKCGNEVKNEARFEFWHKVRADGQKYLSRVLTKSLTDAMDVTFHPEFGRPIMVKKNNQTTTYSYLPNGLVKEKATASSKMTYEYQNSFNKVSKVSTEFFDAKGKSLRKRQTEFVYDTKANLISAQNTDGQSVKLTYDTRGRIASIVDQAKKEVLIKYEERTGKPASITRPKVGTINVSYKANGDINKVDSNDGPTVAVQIASTFNNLLDIIAPATSELNL